MSTAGPVLKHPPGLKRVTRKSKPPESSDKLLCINSVAAMILAINHPNPTVARFLSISAVSLALCFHLLTHCPHIDPL